MRKVKIAAGHYRIGNFDVVVERAGHAGEGSVWWIYRGEASTMARPFTSAVSLRDAHEAIVKGVIH